MVDIKVVSEDTEPFHAIPYRLNTSDGKQPYGFWGSKLDGEAYRYLINRKAANVAMAHFVDKDVLLYSFPELMPHQVEGRFGLVRQVIAAGCHVAKSVTVVSASAFLTKIAVDPIISEYKDKLTFLVDVPFTDKFTYQFLRPGEFVFMERMALAVRLKQEGYNVKIGSFVTNYPSDDPSKCTKKLRKKYKIPLSTDKLNLVDVPIPGTNVFTEFADLYKGIEQEAFALLEDSKNPPELDLGDGFAPA